LEKEKYKSKEKWISQIFEIKEENKKLQEQITIMQLNQEASKQATSKRQKKEIGKLTETPNAIIKEKAPFLVELQPMLNLTFFSRQTYPTDPLPSKQRNQMK